MANRTVLAAVVGAAGLALGASGQSVVAGPTRNPANGHRYTLIQAGSWEQARDWARVRGADLATVEDLAENSWLYTTFGASGTRKYLIGLSDTAVPGTLAWSDGSGSAYRRWAAGEPASGAPGHRYAIVQTDQMWYVRGTNYAPYYVVESSGPLRVPEEYASVTAAFQAMNALGTYEVDIAAGVFTVPMAGSTTIPAGRRRGSAARGRRAPPSWSPMSSRAWRWRGAGRWRGFS